MKVLSINKIKQIRGLHLKKNRDELELFIVEGEKMVLEVLESVPNQIEYCVTTSEEIAKQFPVVDFYLADDETLKKCSTLKTPNKLLVVVKKMVFTAQDPTFLIALDGIQDPGNMGTIMRLADWYGVKKIICSNTTVDIYNPKVIQASMGAFLRIHVEYTDLTRYLETSKLPVFGALLEGDNVYQRILKPEGILLMGNEGNGVSEQNLQYITHPISIPRGGKAESLNVSVATGILLSEFFRNQLG